MDFGTVIRLLSKPKLPDKNKKKNIPQDMLDTSPDIAVKVDESLGRVTNKINFTRREWIIVGSLVALLIVVLVILITLVISTL